MPTDPQSRRYSPKGSKLSPRKASAGRANAETRRVPEGHGKSVIGGSLLEFGRACDRMMAEHVPGYRVHNFKGQDITEQVVAEAPEKRQGKARRVLRGVFWKSKPQAAVWSGVASGLCRDESGGGHGLCRDESGGGHGLCRDK